MAIAFRGVTALASGGATDPTSAPALPAGTANGDMVVYGVIVKYAATTIATNPPTGWQDPANNEDANSGLTDSGNDAGNIRVALFFREKDASWSTLPGIDLSGVPNATMVGAISYSKGAGEVWDTPVCATAVDNTVASTGVDPAASGTTISFASGDMFGAFCGVNGDAGTPTVPMTVTVAGVTFGAATTRWNATTSSGTDLRGHSIDRTYTSGTASAGPDGVFTLTTGAATGAGVMVFFNLSLASGTDLTVNNVDQLQVIESPAITQVHEIGVSSVSQLQVLQTPAITQVHTIGANNIDQLQVIESPAITQTHILAANGVSQLQVLETPTLTQVHNLTVQDIAQLQVLETPTIGGGPIDLFVSSIDQLQVIEAPALTQVHNLAVPDFISQLQVLESPVVEYIGPIDLGVINMIQEQVLESPLLELAEPPVAVFTPPLRPGILIYDPNKVLTSGAHALWKFYETWAMGTTVWKDQNADWHETTYPYQGGQIDRVFRKGELISETHDDSVLALANAARVYEGGHVHPITTAEESELIEAGYGDFIT